MNPDKILAMEPTAAAMLAEGHALPKSAPRAARATSMPTVVDLVDVIDRQYAAQVASRLYQVAATASSIVLLVDSPGGSVIASSQLAEVVAEVNAMVPVHAFADGALCSGALYVASQATSITASRQSVVGSIGTILILVDSSALYEKIGLRVVPVSTGRFKSLCLPGTKVTDEDIDAIRQRIAPMNEMFLADLARGRSLSPKYLRDELATGEVWSAPQAMTRGLIDSVERFVDFIDRFRPTTPLPSEQYANLVGEAALRKFESLKSGIGHSTRQCEEVAAKYPKLADEARRYRAHLATARLAANRV